MDSSERFTLEVINQLKKDIEDADGNEVFWMGRVNSQGIVESVKLGSRGNEDSVVVNKKIDREGSVLIHNHPSGNIKPSYEDQSIAMNSTDTSLGFYIIDNSVSSVYVVLEPILPKEIEKLDQDECAFYLSSQGPLAKENLNYEERPSQMELCKNIASVLNKNQIAAFEAGTGVGKSYAYLIPSMLWAIKNKERIVVSTGTINLQQQLCEKDIPAAQEIIGKKIKAVLVKGRQNYLCLRRLSELKNDRDLFSEDTEQIDKIFDWSKTTGTGSRSDLAFTPLESVWSKVCSESDACMGSRCLCRENCFVMKVRKEASDANLLVVNHHLLFADIESRMESANYDETAVLPPYKRIIFDESHGIEDSATSFFSESLTKFSVLKQVNLLFRNWKSSYSGYLVQASNLSKIENFTESAFLLVNELKDKLAQMDLQILSVLDMEFSLRITHENKSKFKLVLESVEKFSISLLAFINFAREVIDLIDEDDLDVSFVWECKNILRRLDAINTLCKKVLDWQEHDDCVFWVQKIKSISKKEGEDLVLYSQLNSTPLDIAPIMNQGVYEQMDSVICTSATLRISKDFNFWARRVGFSFVENDRVLCKDFASPFPYGNNVIFAVPNDAPFPESPYFQAYIEETILKLIKASHGKTLILFTSYDSLRSTYNNIRLSITNLGLASYKQGDEDRFKLLQKFRDDKDSILFATESFWEGVDVPGESLSQVIIVKLPFAVPNDPVFEARSESINKRGGSSFFELSVPQAVIKFRQGFGRLIRRSDDRGVIVVLDRRIVEKSYGKRFTTSVPMTRRMYNSTKDILEAIESFFQK